MAAQAESQEAASAQQDSSSDDDDIPRDKQKLTAYSDRHMFKIPKRRRDANGARISDRDNPGVPAQPHNTITPAETMDFDTSIDRRATKQEPPLPAVPAHQGPSPPLLAVPLPDDNSWSMEVEEDNCMVHTASPGTSRQPPTWEGHPGDQEGSADGESTIRRFLAPALRKKRRGSGNRPSNQRGGRRTSLAAGVSKPPKDKVGTLGRTTPFSRSSRDHEEHRAPSFTVGAAVGTRACQRGGLFGVFNDELTDAARELQEGNIDEALARSFRSSRLIWGVRGRQLKDLLGSLCGRHVGWKGMLTLFVLTCGFLQTGREMFTDLLSNFLVGNRGFDANREFATIVQPFIRAFPHPRSLEGLAVVVQDASHAVNTMSGTEELAETGFQYAHNLTAIASGVASFAYSIPDVARNISDGIRTLEGRGGGLLGFTSRVMGGGSTSPVPYFVSASLQAITDLQVRGQHLVESIQATEAGYHQWAVQRAGAVRDIMDRLEQGQPPWQGLTFANWIFKDDTFTRARQRDQLARLEEDVLLAFEQARAMLSFVSQSVRHTMQTILAVVNILKAADPRRAVLDAGVIAGLETQLRQLGDYSDAAVGGRESELRWAYGDLVAYLAGIFGGIMENSSRSVGTGGVLPDAP